MYQMLVCCSVMQCVAVSSSTCVGLILYQVLQCVAVCCSVLPCVAMRVSFIVYQVLLCCSVLECAAVRVAARV